MKSNKKNWRVIILLIQMILISGLGFSQSPEIAQKTSQDVVPSETVEKLRAIYENNDFAVKSYKAEWLHVGSEYMRLEKQPGSPEQTLVVYNANTGTRTELISTSDFPKESVDGSLLIENHTVSPDGNWLLLTLRSSNQGKNKLDYWMLSRKSGKLKAVKAGRNSSISPDNKHILFSEKGNLVAYNIQDEETAKLTNDSSSGAISYGNATWSPDSKKVVFVQSDATRVRLRSMLVPGDPSYPGVRETKFARVGGTIATLRIGVVDAAGNETSWVSIPIPSEGYYLGQVSWAGNSNELLVEKLSRFRDKREIFIVNITNGSMTRIFEDSDPAWVVASYRTNVGVNWIDGYSKFLVLSEKGGWRHAYVVSRDGMEQFNITPGDYDIIERVSVDESGGWFYFNASPKNGTQSYLYRVRLDGKGKPEKITPPDQNGFHKYTISNDSRWAIHTYSSANTPPVTELVELPEHKVAKVFEDNDALRQKTASFQPVEFFQVDIGNDVFIDGWMIKPNDFDPSRKYPVFIYVYGEPHGQTVRDSWGFAMANYHRVIADLGYIVISMDNRGTPCPKGAAWRRAIAGRLGPLSTEEQALGLKEFGRTRPYADLSRVGIWGWSGGGSNTLNAMFRKPNDYHLGIAVVPKPQAHLYNAWFQEIYMKTPEVNPDGYEKSSPINYAEGLKGNLLIVTGTGETNTHVQIVEGLVDRLIELGKQFDYMAYPNRNHGISEGKGTSLHLRVYMARYLLNHLPAGPR